MNKFAVVLPLEMNQVFDYFSLENFNLFSFSKEIHQISIEVLLVHIW